MLVLGIVLLLVGAVVAYIAPAPVRVIGIVVAALGGLLILIVVIDDAGHRHHHDELGAPAAIARA